MEIMRHQIVIRGAVQNARIMREARIDESVGNPQWENHRVKGVSVPAEEGIACDDAARGLP